MSAGSASLTIGGREVPPGARVSVELELPGLYGHTPITMPVHVVRGRRGGPCMFVSAAVHGDELNGIEIVRRLLARTGLKRLRGTLLAVPIVNVYGVIHRSRYLPDRRDLNRSFPGSKKGSLAARLAELVMSEILSRCDYGIDLHTGGNHRTNLPQVRADLSDEETSRLAMAFGVPVVVDSAVRDGSLREAASGAGVKTLIYEAGEALRFHEVAIRAGVNGVMNVLRALEMVPPRRGKSIPVSKPFVAHSTTWVRAPESGVLRLHVGLGRHVREGDLLGTLGDPFGSGEMQVRAHADGVVIGRTNIPIVQAGEALVNIGRFERDRRVATEVEAFHRDYEEAIQAEVDPPIV